MVTPLFYRSGGLTGIYALGHCLRFRPCNPFVSLITPSASCTRSTRVFSSLQKPRNFSIEYLLMARCLQPPVKNLGGMRIFQHMARHSDRAAPSSASSSTSRAENSKSNPESTSPTAAEQRRTDWTIVKRLMINVWPRNDWKTRYTVLFGFLLLVTAKVCSSTVYIDHVYFTNI